MGFALNIEQQNAVTHSGCPLLIVAGPGSGKTRVIIERILHLIKLGLKPSEILCQIFNFTYCHTRDGPGTGGISLPSQSVPSQFS